MYLVFEYCNTQGGFIIVELEENEQMIGVNSEDDGIISEEFTVRRILDNILVEVNCNMCNVGKFIISFNVKEAGKAGKCDYCREWAVVNIREEGV